MNKYIITKNFRFDSIIGYTKDGKETQVVMCVVGHSRQDILLKRMSIGNVSQLDQIYFQNDTFIILLNVCRSISVNFTYIVTLY